MLVCELLERQEDFRFDRPACRHRVPLKRSATYEDLTNTNKRRRRSKPLIFFPFLIAVYLLILSMVVFNSGTLSLRGWTPSLPPLQTPVPKRKNIFVFLKKILILMHLLLLFSLIYFHLFHFICYFVIILWVFISGFFLPYCYYIIILYGCIKCIYVSWPWVTPLLSWARSALKESGGLVWDKPSKNKSTEWPNVI